MLHNKCGGFDPDTDCHWAVSANAKKTAVLIQLGEGGNQIRVVLTPEQANSMIDLLKSAVKDCVQGY